MLSSLYPPPGGWRERLAPAPAMPLPAVDGLSDDSAGGRKPKPSPMKSKPKPGAKPPPSSGSKTGGSKKRPASKPPAPEAKSEEEVEKEKDPEEMPAEPAKKKKAQGKPKAEADAKQTPMKKPAAKKSRAYKYYYSAARKWGIRGPDGREWTTVPRPKVFRVDCIEQGSDSQPDLRRGIGRFGSRILSLRVTPSKPTAPGSGNHPCCRRVWRKDEGDLEGDVSQSLAVRLAHDA